MNIVKEYNACIYARLSRDDGDKPESDSITNQKALIRDFISKHPEIHVISERTDDGYSGVNFDRPAFQAMMGDICAGKINCVVVKDLSRFGRNYIEAGNYIERVFPFIGVRFIAINDHYDSLERSQSDSLIIPFKNLINDAYCKDISVKIRTQLEVKRKKGQFTGAFAVYGYVKDPENHNHLIPDTFASEVVRKIFTWKHSGMSQGMIAKKLNMQGVLCPMEYKLSQGMKVQTVFRTHEKAMWSARSVTRILTNEVYTGVLIQGKRGTPNYKVKKILPRDESEWIRVENAHEAIVDKQIFTDVQEMLKKDLRLAPDQETVYPLSGYVKCAECGENMVRQRYTSGGHEYAYYICSTWKAGKGCRSHRVPERILEAVVLQAVQSQIESVLEAEKCFKIAEEAPARERNVAMLDSQIVKLKEEIERNRGFRMKLYESLQQGLIGQEEYLLFRKNYSNRIASAENAIQAIEKEKEKMVSQNREQCQWIDTFKRYQNVTKLDRRLVVDLVEQIIVDDKKDIRVCFRYDTEYQRLLA